MIGIYKITNKVNGKSYVGQSNNIERRFAEHCQKGESSRIPLDVAIQKYGKENFTFKILEECSLEELNTKETYWIEYLDTIKEGYNCNQGGDNGQVGSSNSNSKIKEEDVILIRKAYAEHKTQKDIYDNHFKNKITFNHFQNIWQGRVWPHIMPEVFTEENKKYFIYQNSLGSKSIKAEFSDEEVLCIRTRYVNESAKAIYEDYKDRVKFQTFQAILWGRTYTDIPIYSKKQKKWINK